MSKEKMIYQNEQRGQYTSIMKDKQCGRWRLDSWFGQTSVLYIVYSLEANRHLYGLVKSIQHSEDMNHSMVEWIYNNNVLRQHNITHVWIKIGTGSKCVQTYWKSLTASIGLLFVAFSG